MYTTIVSAPGKVLLAGGYLVLDQQYPGLVIATSSRFYTLIRSGGSADSQIRVRSPQFLDAEWNYRVGQQGDVHLDQNEPRNKFVELVISKSLQLCADLKGHIHLKSVLQQGLDIIVLGDNDFYSSRERLEKLDLPPTISSLESLQPFLKLGTSITQAHKTGLGSSAALTTSLTFALLLHLRVVSSENFSPATKSSTGLKLVHNLSQYVHCLAQGKIGSGFDVSSSIYGSHIYRRFNPLVLEPIMNDVSEQALSEVLSSDNPAWDAQVALFRLPPMVRLLLADVEVGSDTPSLVGRVLKWRKSAPEEANTIWNSLDRANRSLIDRLNKLSELFRRDASAYRKAFSKLVGYPHFKWIQSIEVSEGELSVMQSLYDVHETTESIRKQIKNMGNLADVPIEPEEQTTILNETIALPGVIGGGVPGAGGYDALWVFVIDCEGSGVIDAVQRLWSDAKSMRVTPLKVSEGVGPGLQVEEVQRVAGLGDVMKDVGWLL